MSISHSNSNTGTVEGSQNRIRGSYYDSRNVDRRHVNDQRITFNHNGSGDIVHVTNIEPHPLPVTPTPAVGTGFSDPSVLPKPLKTVSFSPMEVLAPFCLSPVEGSQVTPMGIPLSGGTPSELYVRTLLNKGEGLPCWIPEAFDPFTQPRGTELGDVGTYTPEGGFRRIFNLFESQETIRQVTKNHSQDTHYSNQLSSAETINATYLQKHDSITVGAVAKLKSSNFPGMAGPFKQLTYEFRCHTSGGAILATPTAASKVEVRDSVSIRKFICSHVEAIYRHATSIQPLDEQQQLYIVTSCVKGDSWALAVYNGEMPHDGQTLRLESQLSTTPDSLKGHFPVDLIWTCKGTAHTRWGTSESPGVKSQTLFLKGFKIAFSPDFRSRVDGGGATDNRSDAHGSEGGHSGSESNDRNSMGPGGEGGSPHDKDDTSQPDGNGGGGHSSNSHGGQLSLQQMNYLLDGSRGAQVGSDRSKSGSPTARLQLQQMPQVSQHLYHPSDAINAYTLEKTGCDVAICHDDSWIKLLQMHHSSATHAQRVADFGSISVQDGIAFAECTALRTRVID